MDAGPFPSIRHAAHDLTKAASFVLGPLTVDPSTRRIGNCERSEMLEPRVMRVLVALGRAGGKVLSRDDLIDWCWDGTIVGENAIKRVIFRLRHALDDLSGGAVSLETITKVGFRLVYDSSDAANPSAPVEASDSAPVEDFVPSIWSRKSTRRAAVAGVLALGAGSTLAFALWDKPRGHVPHLLASKLYERGLLMRRSASPMNAMIATSFFKQAVVIDPDFADAWGALAISYTAGKRGYGTGAQDSLAMITSTAKRALEIDPNQGEALIAMIETEPDLGHWLDQEIRLRSIVGTHPGLPLAYGRLAMLLASVGRHKEAIPHYQQMLKLEDSLPLGYFMLAEAQHCAGRDYDADATFEEGWSRFPGHFLLWLMRYNVLLGSKRYGLALEFLRDPRNNPEFGPTEKIRQIRLGIAEALATGNGLDRQLSIIRQIVASNIEAGPGSVIVLAELGASDLVFDTLEAYHLGGVFADKRFPPPNPLAKRFTTDMFFPGVLALRDNPRYGALTARLGLEDYWKKSGIQPDFRRA